MTDMAIISEIDSGASFWIALTALISAVSGFFIAVLKEKHRHKKEMIEKATEQYNHVESLAIAALKTQIELMRISGKEETGELRGVIHRLEDKYDKMNVRLIEVTRSEAECRGLQVSTQHQIDFLQKEVQKLRGGNSADGDSLANHVDKIAGQASSSGIYKTEDVLGFIERTEGRGIVEDDTIEPI